MKTGRYLILAVSLLAVVGGFGCAAVSEWATPAEIDKNAVGYAIEAKVAEPNEFAGYGNLIKAAKLKTAVNNAHDILQQQLLQAVDKDNLRYSQLSKTVSGNLAVAQSREEQLFGEQGLLSMGLTMAGFGTLTGFIGLLRKRPQDITTEELNTALAGQDAQLTEKQQQFAELVKGIQGFIDRNEESISEELKTDLEVAQSASTKIEVAKIKATA